MKILEIDTKPDRGELVESIRSKNHMAWAAIILVAFVGSIHPVLDQHVAAHAYGKGDFKSAQVSFDKLVAQNPTDVAALYNAGKAVYAQSNFASAKAYFQEAERNFSDTALPALQKQVTFDCANALAKEKEFQQALEQYKKVLSIDAADTYAPKMIEQLEKLLQQQKQNDQQQQDKDNQKESDKKDQEQQDKKSDGQQQQDNDQQGNNQKNNQNDGQKNQEKNNGQKDNGQQEPSEKNQEGDQRGQSDQEKLEHKNKEKESENNDSNRSPADQKNDGESDQQSKGDSANQKGNQKGNDGRDGDQGNQKKGDLDRQAADKSSDQPNTQQKTQKNGDGTHKDDPSKTTLQDGQQADESSTTMAQLDPQSQRLLDLVAAQEGKTLKELLKVQVKQDGNDERRQYQQEHNW